MDKSLEMQIIFSSLSLKDNLICKSKKINGFFQAIFYVCCLLFIFNKLRIFKHQSDLKRFLDSIGNETAIGFVPTMGALHEGHISLITQSKLETDITICSIFVNPTQFNNLSDLENYPRNLDKDLELLNKYECDLVYIPEINDIYSENETSKVFEFNGLDQYMEGSSRTGHFDGVATIVEKLFRIILPNKAYFGQKDLQQLQIIKFITKNLSIPVKIVSVSTKRESSGLAMSSRNELLKPEEKINAALIYKTLLNVKNLSKTKDINYIYNEIEKTYNRNKLIDLDYFNIVSLETMKPISKIGEEGTNAACIAVYISSIRLIDNIIF